MLQHPARRSRKKLRHHVAALATLLVGFIGSGLFSHGFETHPPARAATRPSLRRAPGMKVEVETVLPSGEVSRTTRYTTFDTPHLGALEIGGRQLDLQHTGSDTGLLEVRAWAAASGPLPAFTATADESGRSLWHLPLIDGLATLRVHVTREYLPA